MRLPLPKAWTLVTHSAAAPRAVRGKQMTGAVPGSVHTDLLRCGAISDLFRNEANLRWIGECEWIYQTEFDWSGGAFRFTDLLFPGLDTIATVSLNGVEVGTSENAFIPHRFAVKSHLRIGANQLTVRLMSPIDYVRKEAARLGTLPWLNTPEPFNFIRKPAHNFGWDWAPPMVTAGIFRGPLLEFGTSRPAKSIRFLTRSLTDARAHLEVEIDRFADDEEGDFDLRFSHAGQEFTAQADGGWAFEVKKPELWFPRGFGRAALHTLNVCRGDFYETQQVGIRTVELNTDEDALGSRFELRINGLGVFAKGANWIPNHSLPDRARDQAVIIDRIRDARLANMNMLRVWGGGGYEADIFYEECDRQGMMVWQDFPFACACYPEEAPHWGNVEREARFQVARLVSRPSVVLFNGCNENLWGFEDWDWKTKTKSRTWGAGYYFDLLPRVVKELAGPTPYWPGSPYSGTWNPGGEPHPQDRSRGNVHIWDDWEEGVHPIFGKEAVRFSSEFGLSGPAAAETLEEAVGSVRDLRSSEVQHYQRSERAEERCRRLVLHYFGNIATELEHHARQLLQARLMGDAVLWLRSQAPVCAGSIIWQLNDCWPALSWSAVDSAGRKKLLWHALKNAYQNRQLTFQPAHPNLSPSALYLINDEADEWKTEVRLTRRRMGGEILAERVCQESVRARATKELPTHAILPFEDPRVEFLLAETPGNRAWFFPLPDCKTNYPDPKFNLERLADGVTLLTARTLIRELCLYGRKQDHPLLSLLPGESTKLADAEAGFERTFTSNTLARR